jgi:hypothetical protein
MQIRHIIKPYEKFGDILFDESRENIRKKLGAFKEFKKNIFSENTADDYGDIIVCYDKFNKMEAVEVFSGDVFIEDVKIFPNTRNKLIESLKKLDNTFSATDDAIESSVLGICAYAPEDEVESLIVYRHGYYSN